MYLFVADEECHLWVTNWNKFKTKVKPTIESRLQSAPFLPLERQSLKNAWNKLCPDLEDEKDFNDDHREEITDFVQSIPGFQECDEEDVET
ncbi:hypothetical protein TNCV_1105501 [Trichonephila clavipes]|nr:hypothetical protein TNCV_1105501 [Trichonephila clavipes]